MVEVQKHIQKYNIIEKIEESNYAVIYKARISEEKPVVLKIARDTSVENNELISREFQILSQFKHPNIVSVFDYGITEDGRAYFTQEYILDKPIHEFFKGFSEEFLAAVIQVINGLGAFHNKGFIHCDLKPEHILYNQKETKALLIDFGFAGTASENVKLAGTMGYMAPEVLKGIGIDQRSDLYSLGVIIYEVLSGKRLKDPYEPIKDIPEELNNVIARLVSREPAIRPTVPELYQTLGQYVKSLRVEIPSYQVALPETGFVEIPEIVEKLSSAKGRAIIISGDTGSGKTRLLQEMKFRYLLTGHSVLSHISKEKTHFYEALQTFLKIKKIDFTNKDNKFQIYEEILEELLNYAKDRNVIIMVDDLEGLSDYSLRLFRYIGYGIKDSNILLIGASKVTDRVNKLGFETLTLRPFTQDETQKLLEKTFFAIEPAEVSKKIANQIDFTQWLHRQSGGNPLFIREILKTLYNNSVLYYQAFQWQIKIDMLKEVAIPSKLDELLETRLLMLGDEELKILKILSLTDYPSDPAIINSVLKSDVNVATEHLKNLGLLREEIINNRRIVSVPNQILTDIIRKNLSETERQSLSKALVKAIETIVPEDKDYLPVLGWLNDEIGEHDKAYTYFHEAAENAETMYDYESAIQYYRKLAKYSKTIHIEKYPEILVRSGDLNQMIGDNRLAIEYYRKALKSATKNFLPKIYSKLGKTYGITGEHNKAVDYDRKAMQYMDDKCADYIYTANHLGYILTNLSKFEAAETIFNKSLVLSKKINNIETEVDTLYYQASMEWARNNFDKGLEKAQNLLEFCKKNKLSKQYAFCANALGSLYRQKSDTENAQKYLDFAIDGFYKTKNIGALCAAMSSKVLLHKDKGELSHAKALSEEAFVRSQQSDNQILQYVNLVNIGVICEDLGRFEDAITFNKKAIDINPDSLMPNYSLAMVFYKKDESDKAKSLLERKLKEKEEILYYVGLALINIALGITTKVDELLEKGQKLIEKQNPNISTRIESFLKAAQCYYEKGDFVRSVDFSNKAIKIANPLSKEHNFASAFTKISNFNLKRTKKININQESERLKQIGCIYDYAYLKKLQIESVMGTDVKQEEIKQIAENISAIQEIFESMGANLELNRVKKLQEKLFPIIVKDYSRRMISNQYLETFSNLAELINSHLGDEDFIQNLLDLVIKATNAERGAVFTKTAKGMEFLAGRDMDKTTIKDASELSNTAIKELEENKIVFAQDALSDPKFNIKKSVMLNQIRSLLCIPLSVSENIIGAIYLDSKIASGIFGPQDKDFLFTVSKILASVIEKSIAFQAVSEENILLKSNIIQEIGSGYLMGKSRTMKRIYKVINSVAETNSPVLILGETGTGKGMIARLVHLRSKRKDKKFLTINCGTIAETLLESELFGHKKGAFTGAISDKKGLLEGGEGGTIFLDEISNTSLSFQGKLLEAIEEKIIRRIGETTTRSIDVRFLFATNRDLEIEIEDGRFRRDLFYRINVFKIEVPPLRDRPNDIPLLAQFFLDKYTKDINKKIEGFAPEAMQRLREYLWPGNVRELQNVVERAVVLAKTKLITIKDIGFEKVRREEIMPLKEIKREVIIEALNLSNWNVKKAAESLGIGRRTLHRYIKKYNIVKDTTITVYPKK